MSTGPRDPDVIETVDSGSHFNALVAPRDDAKTDDLPE
jgi:hypothetical protein